MTRFMKSRLSFLLLIVSVAIASAEESAAQGGQDNSAAGSFQRVVNDIAKKGSEYLKKNPPMEIGIGKFIVPNDADSASRRIKKAFADAFEAEGVAVIDSGASWILQGSISAQRDGKLFRCFISADIVDRLGQVKISLPKNIETANFTDRGDIASILGIILDVSETLEEEAKKLVKTDSPESTDADVPNVAEELENSIVNPKPVVSGSGSGSGNTQLSAGPNSKFRLEVLVQKQGVGDFIPWPIKIERGLAEMADLEVGDMYMVRVYNDSANDVGVKLAIDGINVFQFSEDLGMKKLGMWLVPAKTAGKILGWYKRPTGIGNIRKFQLATKDTVLNELPPAVLGNSPQGEQVALGMINAQFFLAWKPSEQKPLIEQFASRGVELRTVVGPPLTKAVKLEPRFFGTEMLASLTVRYSFPPDLPAR